MTHERRLIQDAAPGELRHRLLRAGREAAPSAESRQRLLGAVLPLVDVPALNAGASKGGLQAAASSLKASLAAKLAVLSVIGAAATGAWYAAGGHGADGPSPAPAPAEAASEQRVATPAVAEEPNAAPAAAGAAPGAPPLHVEDAEPALPPARPSVEPTAAHAPRATANPRPWARSASRQRLARVARSAMLHPTRELAPAEAPRDSEALRDSRAQQAESASTQPPSAAPSAEPAQARAAKDSPPLSPEDTYLREELRQLDAVRDALRYGDRAAAQQRLQSYFERFPHGFLAPEARRLAQEARAPSAR